MIGTAMFSFFMGVLFGVLSEWNKRVFFWIIIGVSILAVVTIFGVGMEEIEKSFDVLRHIVGAISTLIGFFAGSKFYQVTIGDKEK